MTDWRVIVVEDDPVVARMHCRFVARVPGFEIAGVAGTAVAAEHLIRRLRPDLLLLDLGLPDRSGIDLLRDLRARGDEVEAIAVTAASDAPIVRSTVHLGVVDYLVKPFDQERLRQSLSLFTRRMAMLSGSRLRQPEVDRLRTDGPGARRWLPRDLSPARLEQVRRSFAEATGAVTAAQLAEVLGISRVTARRYLEYLVTIGRARASEAAVGPGRPTKTYTAVSDHP
jgi:response regulator of citrate/malate metabolism